MNVVTLSKSFLLDSRFPIFGQTSVRKYWMENVRSVRRIWRNIGHQRHRTFRPSNAFFELESLPISDLGSISWEWILTISYTAVNFEFCFKIKSWFRWWYSCQSFRICWVYTFDEFGLTWNYHQSNHRIQTTSRKFRLSKILPLSTSSLWRLDSSPSSAMDIL